MPTTSEIVNDTLPKEVPARTDDNPDFVPETDWTQLDVNENDLPTQPGAQPDPSVVAAADELQEELAGDNPNLKEATANAQSAPDAAIPDALEQMRGEALSLGYRSEDVQSLDGERLRALVEVQRRLAMQAVSRPQLPQQPWMQQQPLPPQQPWGFPPQQQAYQQPPQQPQVPQFQLQLPTDDPDPTKNFDPALVEQLNQMNQFYGQQVAALQQHILTREQQAQQQQAMLMHQAQQQREFQESRDFDAWIEKQGESFAPLFGKGDAVQGPQLRARQEVYLRASLMERQAQAAGINVDKTWIRDEAARQVLGNQYDFFKQQAAREPLAKRQRQFTQRANGQNTKPRSGRESAGSFVEQFFAERVGQ